MKIVFLALVAVALIAATGSPAPTATPQSPQVATAEQIQLQQYANAFHQVQVQLQSAQLQLGTFETTTYAPYCAAHRGSSTVALMGQPDKNGIRPAWPAVISCKDGRVFSVRTPLQPPKSL